MKRLKKFSAEDLSKTEIKIIQLLCKEFSTAEISEKLGYSSRTVEGYRQEIVRKIGAKNTIGVVLFALKEGIVVLK